MPEPRRTVIAHHLIWTTYGTWLPNDPRGSGSHNVYTPAIAELGAVHFGRRRQQPVGGVIREFYRQAEPKLQFPVIRFGRHEIQSIATALADTIHTNRYTCYACAVMPDHVHLIIRKHRHRAEEIIDRFQDDSRSWLGSREDMPAEHPVWTKGGWKRFLDAPRAVRACIQYVQKNPLEIHWPRQSWPFVSQYDNWPFHNIPK